MFLLFTKTRKRNPGEVYVPNTDPENVPNVAKSVLERQETARLKDGKKLEIVAPGTFVCEWHFANSRAFAGNLIAALKESKDVVLVDYALIPAEVVEGMV